MLATLNTHSAINLLFILLAFGCFTAAAIAGWRGAWITTLILAAIGIITLATAPN